MTARWSRSKGYRHCMVGSFFYHRPVKRKQKYLCNFVRVRKGKILHFLPLKTKAVPLFVKNKGYRIFIKCTG